MRREEIPEGVLTATLMPCHMRALSLSLCVCVVYICASLHIHVHGCLFKWRPENDVRIHPQLLFDLIQESLNRTQSFLIQPIWLASFLQGALLYMLFHPLSSVLFSDSYFIKFLDRNTNLGKELEL